MSERAVLKALQKTAGRLAATAMHADFGMNCCVHADQFSNRLIPAIRTEASASPVHAVTRLWHWHPCMLANIQAMYAYDPDPFNRQTPAGYVMQLVNAPYWVRVCVPACACTGGRCGTVSHLLHG